MHKHSATQEHKHVYSYLLAYQMKKLPKNWKHPNDGWQKDHREMTVLKKRNEGEERKS